MEKSSKLKYNVGDCFVVNPASELKHRYYMKIVKENKKDKRYAVDYKCLFLHPVGIRATNYNARLLNFLILDSHYELCTSEDFDAAFAQFSEWIRS